MVWHDVAREGRAIALPFFVQGVSVRPPHPTSPFVGEEFLVVYSFFSITNYISLWCCYLVAKTLTLKQIIRYEGIFDVPP